MYLRARKLDPFLFAMLLQSNAIIIKAIKASEQYCSRTVLCYKYIYIYFLHFTCYG